MYYIVSKKYDFKRQSFYTSYECAYKAKEELVNCFKRAGISKEEALAQYKILEYKTGRLINW